MAFERAGDVKGVEECAVIADIDLAMRFSRILELWRGGGGGGDPAVQAHEGQDGSGDGEWEEDEGDGSEDGERDAKGKP